MYREIAGEDPTKLTVKEFEPEALPANGIRVKVEYAAPKHGTELHGFFHGPDPVYYDDENALFYAGKTGPGRRKASACAQARQHVGRSCHRSRY